MLRAIPKISSLLAALLVGVVQAAVQEKALRSIEFETAEVTQASITVSPDGELLVFTMLGHLFQLPVEGGSAVQLTFGPHYNADPAFSPNGERLAFISDRDGSEGNVFLLELETGEVNQLTYEKWVGRPMKGGAGAECRAPKGAWRAAPLTRTTSPRLSICGTSCHWAPPASPEMWTASSS